MVYVLNKNGKPLMPTQRHGKVRRLLRDGKAKVILRCPFTIKLLYDTSDIVQELTLGVDTGSSVIGSAVYSSNGSILYTAKTTIRNDIKEKMDQRRQFRRTRRNRKTRYRKPRFLNRGNSIRENRFSPTMASKDIITDKTFSLLDNRDTCDCFHCGKTIEAGDELIFGQTSEEIYCSHECVSLNIDNEEWTALSDPDEYLPWFPEKE